jgi:hypothetical protein
LIPPTRLYGVGIGRQSLTLETGDCLAEAKPHRGEVTEELLRESGGKEWRSAIGAFAESLVRYRRRLADAIEL